MFKRIKIFFWRITRKKVVADCGHESLAVKVITIHGKKHMFSWKNLKRVKFCFDCFEKAIVYCAWCGEPIFPDDPITLYSPKDLSYVPKEGSVKYSDNPATYVGCLGTKCADTGADRAGFWECPGQVAKTAT